MAEIKNSPRWVNFDKPTFKRFKETYQKAIDSKKDTFTFENHEYLVGYAKYVIEYIIEGKF